MRRLRIRPKAEADLSEAYVWYEGKVRDLGDAFLDEVERSYDLIKENPFLFQEVEQGVRRALTRRFPYNIYYLTSDEVITVIAILRQSRRPGIWRERL